MKQKDPIKSGRVISPEFTVYEIIGNQIEVEDRREGLMLPHSFKSIPILIMKPKDVHKNQLVEALDLLKAELEKEN